MLLKNVTGIMRRTIIVWFVTLCCLFVEICGSSPQLSPQIPQKLVSHVKTDLKLSPAEEFLPRWVKTNPKTLHVEPLGSMVCNRYSHLSNNCGGWNKRGGWDVLEKN